MNSLLHFIVLAMIGLHTSAQVNSTITHNGITRNHITYVPASYVQGTPTPLVFVMHGFTQSASAIMGVTGFNALAEQEGFLVAYPNGVNNGWNTNSPFPGGSTADDVGYIGALLDSLQAQYSVDTTRVYACGFSAGGYMSHKLGCESPKCFAAIASVSGTINNGAVGDCAPQHTPGVLQIHGTSDFIVSYNGSVFSGLGVQEVLDLWTSNLACATPPVVTPYNATMEQQVYSPCSGSASVVHYKIDGGGHTWPTGSTFSATNVIWDFFQGFTCGDISTAVQSASAPQLAGWPNPAGDLLFLQGLERSTGFTLIDAMGRSVLTGRVQPGTAHIGLDGISTGAYVLRLLDGSGRTLRILKQ
ncbi:MAG: prolyl oligopeptidase family serine peptidase [Flavobacteriales bacterium]|nr:prolyl oligopeptidase family serine peptidase [Flavobacteriales bacterium]